MTQLTTFDRDHAREIDDAVGAALVANPWLVIDAISELPKAALIELGFAAKCNCQAGVSDIVLPAVRNFVRQRCAASVRRRYDRLQMHDGPQWCEVCNLKHCECGDS